MHGFPDGIISPEGEGQIANTPANLSMRKVFLDPAGYDGSTDSGYNITSPNSEMSYMYYVGLGNLGYISASGSCSQSGWGLLNTDLFQNLMNTGWTSGDPRMDAAAYWARTVQPDSNSAFDFRFKYGDQSGHSKSYDNYAWAVRDM